MNLPLLPLLLALNALGPVAAQPASLRPATSPTQLSGAGLDGSGRPLQAVRVFPQTTFDGATTDAAGQFAPSRSALPSPAGLAALWRSGRSTKKRRANAPLSSLPTRLCPTEARASCWVALSSTK